MQRNRKQFLAINAKEEESIFGLFFTSKIKLLKEFENLPVLDCFFIYYYFLEELLYVFRHV